MVGIDDALYGITFNPVTGTMTEYKPLGGAVKGSPSCASAGSSEVTCAVVGIDDALFGITFNPAMTPVENPSDPFVSIPSLNALTLMPDTTKVIEGRMSTDPTDAVDDPNGGIVDADTAGDLALVGLLDGANETCCYQNTVDFVFTDVQCNGQTLTQPGFQLFSDAGWQVDQGTLNGIEPALPAFTIHEATRKATCFAGTKHALFYQFASREKHTVYDFQNGQLNPILTIDADQITVGEWTRLGTLVANDIQGQQTLVIAPTATNTSSYHALGNGVEGATIGDTSLGRHVQLRYTVPGQPFDTERDFVAGPADFDNIYGHNRPFFHVTDGMRFGVVWQARNDGRVYVTWFDNDPAQFETKTLPTPDDTVLAAATSDGSGALYIFMIQAGNGACPRRDREASPPKCSDDATRAGTLIKTDANGSELSRRRPDMSAGSNGLDVVEFGTLTQTRWVADLQHANGRLGLILARLTHMSQDGLNHQGAIAAVFDAVSLELLKHLGQTSGHSWDNVLNLDAEGNFLGGDLGDNFFRGVSLHRFNHLDRKSRVVYTFKTKHGEAPSNGAGGTFEVFTEISDEQVTFYRWSNDNRTYSELGGVLDTPQSILVVFAGERSNLNNQRAQQNLNDPRNLAMVSIRRDFEVATRDVGGETVVTDDLVLSQGDGPVTGRYYTFGGDLVLQRNAGIIWLTNYDDTSQNASRVKLHPLSANEVLILWEVWGPSTYRETYAMSVRPDGTVVQSPVALSSLFRLNRRSDLFDHAGHIYSVAGAGTQQQLILNVLVRVN